jgi:hypothetical protein
VPPLVNTASSYVEFEALVAVTMTNVTRLRNVMQTDILIETFRGFRHLPVISPVPHSRFYSLFIACCYMVSCYCTKLI